jgi:hypothetical protein
MAFEVSFASVFVQEMWNSVQINRNNVDLIIWFLFFGIWFGRQTFTSVFRGEKKN